MQTENKVFFDNRGINMAGLLFLPADLDTSKQYPAVVVSHPGCGVKEQTAGQYAKRIAEQGYVTLAFDASYQGESGGTPHNLDDPHIRVDDISAALDYLDSLEYVDNDRTAALGVCAGGMYTMNAAITDKRIKAAVSVSGVDLGRFNRQAGTSATLNYLNRIAEQRAKEASGAPVLNNPTRLTSKEGLTDLDFIGAYDYYSTERGMHPRSMQERALSTEGNLVTFDAWSLADQLLVQPLLIVTGTEDASFHSPAQGEELYNLAASDDKTLVKIKGASHFDLYDIRMDEVLTHVMPFLKRTLA